MNDYKFTNNQLIIEELYTEANPSSGRKPKPLKSNWMMRHRELPPARPTITKFFIDDLSGETICEARDMQAALTLLDRLKKKGIRACIRPETFDEQRYQDDARKNYRTNGYQKGFGGG